MNFISGKLDGADGPAFVSPELTLRAPVDGQTGRDLVLGIRPQDLLLVSETEPSSIRGRVWVVELLGSEKLVEVEVGDRRRLTVQTRADTSINVDDQVGVRVDPQRVLLFDASTGLALLPRNAVQAHTGGEGR